MTTPPMNGVQRVCMYVLYVEYLSLHTTLARACAYTQSRTNNQMVVVCSLEHKRLRNDQSNPAWAVAAVASTSAPPLAILPHLSRHCCPSCRRRRLWTRIGTVREASCRHAKSFGCWSAKRSAEPEPTPFVSLCRCIRSILLVANRSSYLA